MARHLSLSGGAKPPAAHTLILPMCLWIGVCLKDILKVLEHAVWTKACGHVGNALACNRWVFFCNFHLPGERSAGTCSLSATRVWTLMWGDEASFTPSGSSQRCLRGWGQDFVKSIQIFFTPKCGKILLSISLCPQGVSCVSSAFPELFLEEVKTLEQKSWVVC